MTDLIPEDGTGVVDADTYNTVDQFKTYAGLYGLDIEAFDDTQIEQALRRSASYLDARYAGRFPGTRVKGRLQARAFPRENGLDSSGEAIADDTVPVEIMSAQNEVAFRELKVPFGLSPDETNKRVTEKTIGPLTTKWEYTSDDSRPIANVVDDLLVGLLGGSGTNFAFINRA